MNRLEMPANLSLMDTNSSNMQRFGVIDSLDTFDGISSNHFHPKGLYSTEIFGRSGSPERDETFAVIRTKVPLIHPFLFKKITKLKGLYGDIIAGRAYAVWNAQESDFEISDIIQGQTGYHFFIQHLSQIKFKATDSEKRVQTIKLIEKAIADRTIFVTHVPVMPAGLRDAYIEEDGRVTEDEINPLYRAILSAANALPDELSRHSIKDALSDHRDIDYSMYNTTRNSMQNALNGLFDYIWNLYRGKGGYAQQRYYSRGVFNGTRNVVTAIDSTSSHLGAKHGPKLNNTTIGLFQTMKMTLPVTQHLVLTGLVSKAFSSDGRAYLVNSKTLKSELVSVDRKTYDYYNTPQGVEKAVNQFFNRSRRGASIVVKPGYYLGLVYRGVVNGQDVFRVFNDIDELPKHLSLKDVHPLTWAEYFYIAGYRVWYGLPCMNTRYPVAGLGSTYMAKMYVKTTAKGLVKYELSDDWETLVPKPSFSEVEYAYEYPDPTSTTYVETASVSNSRLAGLSMDFDGDTGSFIALYTQEAIKEITQAMRKAIFYKNPKGGLLASPYMETVQRTVYGLMSR